jgi:hypothetical protein
MASFVNPNKNEETLDDFEEYCYGHPELRFWQALRSWAGVNFVLVSDECPVFNHTHDTFYWTGRTK